jgi:hypothetical protein
MDDENLDIEVAQDVDNARERLQSFCQRGYVVDLILNDGQEQAGVLIGVSTTSLILDHWDEQKHRPANNPYVLELSSISRIEIP